METNTNTYRARCEALYSVVGQVAVRTGEAPIWSQVDGDAGGVLADWHGVTLHWEPATGYGVVLHRGHEATWILSEAIDEVCRLIHLRQQGEAA